MIKTVEKVQPMLKLNIWRKLNLHIYLNGCVAHKEFTEFRKPGYQTLKVYTAPLHRKCTILYST